MNRLTPIHIRGKRKAKHQVASLPHEVQGTETHINEVHDPLPLSQRAKRSLIDALAHRKKLRPYSLIESLPLEVLESILLAGGSFALPRASLLIGAKLSGKATLLKLFFAAFHDTWDQGFGKTVEIGPMADPGLGNGLVTRDRQGDPDLQSEVLALPWATLDFLLDAQQIWAEKHGRDRTFHHLVPIKRSSGRVPHEESHPPMSSSSVLPQANKFNARDCFEADYKRARKSPIDLLALPARMMDVHPLTRVPTRLISGPWTEEDRRRLFWLTRAGAVGNAVAQKHVPWETRVSCIRNMAIYNPHPDEFVEMCLMAAENSQQAGSPWLYDGLPTDVAGDMVDEISKRLDWGDDDRKAKEALVRTRTYLQDSIQRTAWHSNVP